MDIGSNTWLVTFRDDPAMLQVRQERGAEHNEYIAQHADQILLAGGLRYSDQSPFVGGAWLVSAPEIGSVKSLIENDPYYHPNHRKYDISYWGLFHTALQVRNV